MWFDWAMWIILAGVSLTIYFHSRTINNMILTQENHFITLTLLIAEQARIRDVVAHHLGKEALGELYNGVELTQNKEPK